MTTPLIIFSAPSGTGKDTVLELLLEGRDDVYLHVSHTTRDRRPHEEDGRHYHFVGRDEFEEMIKRGEFLEHAEYADNLYGSSRKLVEDKLREGLAVILEVEVQGALQLAELLPEATMVFLSPAEEGEEMSVLRKRLEGRGDTASGVIERRLETAAWELTQKTKYHRTVINHEGRLEEAVAELSEIVSALMERSARAGGQ